MSKALNKAIEKCKNDGAWDKLYVAIVDVVIDDAEEGLFPDKKDMKAIRRFVGMYGNTEQRMRMSNVSR